MREAPLKKSKELMNAIAIAFILGTITTLAVLFVFGGWDYYTTPLRVRGYEPAHRILRPSGSIGHLLGILGTLVLFSTLPYVVRKRVKRFSKIGALPKWLEFHVLCGVFGPILITLHTSLKFNGVISVAYWSMVLVMLSGFVGRSLYIRIPRTLRDHELTRAELDQRLSDLASEMEEHAAAEARSIEQQREAVARRILRLQRVRKAFHIWHVFHRPFVWVMFLIFFVHLGVAIYFGYTYFGGVS